MLTSLVGGLFVLALAVNRVTDGKMGGRTVASSGICILAALQTILRAGLYNSQLYGGMDNFITVMADFVNAALVVFLVSRHTNNNAVKISLFVVVLILCAFMLEYNLQDVSEAHKSAHHAAYVGTRLVTVATFCAVMMCRRHTFLGPTRKGLGCLVGWRICFGALCGLSLVLLTTVIRLLVEISQPHLNLNDHLDSIGILTAWDETLPVVLASLTAYSYPPPPSEEEAVLLSGPIQQQPNRR